MSKRGGSFQSPTRSHPLSKKKRVPLASSEDKTGTMDCSTPEATMQSLLGTVKTADFFEQYWEKKPLLVQRSDSKFYGEFFTLAMIKEVVKVNTLNLLWDVNISSYENGDKKDFGEECKGNVSVEMIDKMMDENKATFKFDQPQRYMDVQWKVLEKLESFFGMLVGSEGYITPAGSQGYAPHCDDSESFILQTEGKQEWKVYKPLVELPTDFTQDLPEDAIGEPVFQSVLDEGDMLYIPRGFIYASKAEASSHSTHSIFSTYEQSSIGDFMCHALHQAIENAIEDNAFFRSGLPINYRSFLGTARNMGAYVADAEECEKEEKEGEEKKGEEKEVEEKKTVKEDEDAPPFPSNLLQTKVVAFKERIQSALSKLSEYIDVNKTADTMCSDFMWSRLPPYGHVSRTSGTEKRKLTAELEKSESEPNSGLGEAKTDGGNEKMEVTASEEKTIKVEDKIKIKFPDHVRVIYCNAEDDDDDDNEDDDFDATDGESQTEDDDSQASEMDDDNDKKNTSATEEKKKDEQEVESSKPDDDDEDKDAVILDSLSHLKVLHSLSNDRFSHMAFGMFDMSTCIKFDVAYSKALIQMTEAADFLIVRDLLLDSDVEKLDLVTKLASQGLLEVQSQ